MKESFGRQPVDEWLETKRQKINKYWLGKNSKILGEKYVNMEDYLVNLFFKKKLGEIQWKSPKNNLLK